MPRPSSDGYRRSKRLPRTASSLNTGMTTDTCGEWSLRSTGGSCEKVDTYENHEDTREPCRAEHLAEQYPCGNRIHHVAQRQHGIRDADLHARECDEPDTDDQHVADETRENGSREEEIAHAAEKSRGSQGERTDLVGARFQQELGDGVQEHAGHDQGERDRAHGRRTATRSTSSPMTFIGNPPDRSSV